MKLLLGMITEELLYEKQKCLTYRQYRDLMHQLVEDGATSGNEQSESLVNFTKLNDSRMRRWDKTVNIPDDIKERLKHFKGNETWIVIAESWCADGAHVIPVIHKIAELLDGVDFKLVLRDENDGLMNQFLTNGGRAIPKLIMIDNETNEVVGTYGPRPSVVTKIVEEFKLIHGKVTPEFKEDLQRWYNSDKGQAIIDDLVTLLGV